jgi:DNA-binding PadR family transcriptional regulator
LVLLGLIGEGERHGYELMRDIEERTGGVYVPSPGVVYPTLTLLQDMGLVRETESGGARKSFTITPDGKTMLAEQAEQIQSLIARLDAIGRKVARADSAPVRRAMGNLKQVLMDRLSKSGTTDEHILEAARIIDEVAGRIERM